MGVTFLTGNPTDGGNTSPIKCVGVRPLLQLLLPQIKTARALAFCDDVSAKGSECKWGLPFQVVHAHEFVCRWAAREGSVLLFLKYT